MTRKCCVSTRNRCPRTPVFDADAPAKLPGAAAASRGAYCWPNAGASTAPTKIKKARPKPQPYRFASMLRCLSKSLRSIHMLPAWGPIVAAESRKPARCFSSPIRKELKKTQEKTDGFASVAQRPSPGDSSKLPTNGRPAHGPPHRALEGSVPPGDASRMRPPRFRSLVPDPCCRATCR